MLALWTPLILTYPSHFLVQFSNNVLNPAGPGLLTRLVWPFSYLAYQTGILLEQTQRIQFGLMSLGMLATTAVAAHRRDSGLFAAVALAWSGLYLLAAASGGHPSNGYWCYPTALVFLCVAYVAVAAGRRLADRLPRPALGWAVGGLLLVATMVPGSGIRAWVAHLRHWSDVNYSAPRFTRGLLADLPDGARLIVDPVFVFDAYLAGRTVAVGWNARARSMSPKCRTII